MISVSVHVFVISIISALVLAGLLFSGALDSESTDSIQYRIVEGDKTSTSKILSVKVSGIILGDASESPSALPFLSEGVTFGYQVKDELRKAAKDDDIKAVLIEINSPGGTIYGSRAIADGVREYKESTGKPVIAYVAGLAASGGYMAAVTSDQIYADYGSTTGSIGVIFGPIKFYDTVISEGGLLEGEVVTQNGIESTFFSAGKSKDLGNPYRELTDDERTQLQEMVNSEYSSFVNFVSENREIPEQSLRNTIGALIYANESATQLGLIDETLNKQQAYQSLAQTAGVSDFHVVEKMREFGFIESLIEGRLFKPQTKNFCLPSESILAYHGNISVLCGTDHSR